MPKMDEDGPDAVAGGVGGPALPPAAVRMPGFDDLFRLCCPPGSAVPYQLGRGSFGAVFVCELRPEARAIVPTLCPDLITPFVRDLLLHAGLKFACKYVMLPDIEASEVYDKEVEAALQFNARVDRGPWEMLARATLTRTLLGWSDDLLSPVADPDTGHYARATMPWLEAGQKLPILREARLIRTVMELNYNSLPGGRMEDLPLFRNNTRVGEAVPANTRQVGIRDGTTGVVTAREIPDVRKDGGPLAGTG